MPLSVADDEMMLNQLKDPDADVEGYAILRSVVALEGRRVELRCYASGYPPPGEIPKLIPPP